MALPPPPALPISTAMNTLACSSTEAPSFLFFLAKTALSYPADFQQKSFHIHSVFDGAICGITRSMIFLLRPHKQLATTEYLDFFSFCNRRLGRIFVFLYTRAQQSQRYQKSWRVPLGGIEQVLNEDGMVETRSFGFFSRSTRLSTFCSA